MADIRERLIRCFAGTFPEVSEAELPAASIATLGIWDSLRSITLMTVIEQEFGVEIPEEELEQFVSFALIEDYLEREAGGGAS